MKRKATEVLVERQGHPVLLYGLCEKHMVRFAWTRRLGPHHVMAFRTERMDRMSRNVLICKYAHHARRDAGKECTCSDFRSSLAYCKQACTSSFVRAGYCSRRSSTDQPCARSSTTKATAMRVPVTTGFPPRTSCFTSMRSCQFMCLDAKSVTVGKKAHSSAELCKSTKADSRGIRQVKV